MTLTYSHQLAFSSSPRDPPPAHPLSLNIFKTLVCVRNLLSIDVDSCDLFSVETVRIRRHRVHAASVGAVLIVQFVVEGGAYE